MGQNRNTNDSSKDIEFRAWDSFRLAHDRVVGRLDADLGNACEISLSEFEILSSLYDSEGRQLRMSRLADMARLSPSGLTRRFDSLTKRGWVNRERCEDDRRGVIAVLTKEGAKVVKAAAPVYRRGARDYFFEVLGEKTTKSLGAALAKVASANVVA